MKEPFRIFGLLLYKNLLVKNRHWKTTIIVEALIPIALVAMMQAVRDFSASPPITVNTSTYYMPINEKDLLHSVSVNLNLFYMPYNNYTAHIMETTQKCLGTQPEKLRAFATEEELLKAYTIEQAAGEYYQALAVIFDQSVSYGSHVFKYTIRHDLNIPNNLYQDILQGFSNPAQYFNTIQFTQLQICLDRSFITESVRSAVDTEMSLQRMPYPPYVKTDDADAIMRMVICRIVVIVFLIPLCIETNFVAKEKSIGVNALTSMNGVRLYQHLLSWLMTGILFSIIYVIPITVLLKNTFSIRVEPYLHYGNTFIFCILLFTHVAHLITFGMHVSAYFSKPRFVVTALSILYMASFSLHQHLIVQQSFSGIPFLGIFFPNVLLFRLIEEANTYESKMIGIQWHNMFKVSDVDYNVSGSVGSLFLFSILGILLHFFAAVYANALLPGKYGVPKNPLYFLQRSRRNKVSGDEKAGDFTYAQADGVEDFEVVPSGALVPGIEIRNLKKTYKTGWLKDSRVQALRGISVDFYKGQITALLGHNGAGKTTLMSILTGMIPETDGKVFINGKNISSDLDVIRCDLGLCPQQNMFFPDLNVFQQIRFFGMLKSGKHGKSKKQIEHDVHVLLDKLKLSEKKNTLPDELSGGQKRRLCLGMALIGDGSILVLDEPTSGMDPETRRDTWDVLLKMRGDKTIVLSTHDMEEADILGDRIAIVHTGRLKCYGSSMFLKKQYGQGCVQVSLSTKSPCDSEKILNKFDSARQKVNVNGTSIVLGVPYTDSLPRTLDEIERQKDELGVTGIDVSLITLEQVFLKVTKNDDSAAAEETEPIGSKSLSKLSGWPLYRQSVLALFDKKFTYTRKNIRNLLMIMLIPLLSTVVTSLFNQEPTYDMSVHPLRLDMYGSSKALYLSQRQIYGEHYKTIVESFSGRASSIDPQANIIEALLDIGKTDITDYRNNYIISAEFSLEGDKILSNGLFSGTALHSVPLTVNLLTNTLIKAFAGDHYAIELSTQRLPPTLRDTRIQLPEMEAFVRVLTFSLFLFSTMTLYVVHPMQETTTIVKQLQRMTGITAFTYWNVMLLSDLIIYLISVSFMLAGFYTMDVLVGSKLYTCVEISVLSLSLMLFGINALLVGYIFSFVKRSRNTVVMILSLVPLGLTLFQYFLHMVTTAFATEMVHALQKRIFRLIPYISFFHGQISFYNVTLQNARCRRLSNRLIAAACQAFDSCCALQCSGDGTCEKHHSYFGDFSWDINIEESLVYLAVTPFFYYLILIMMEERILQKFFGGMAAKTKPPHESEAMDEEVKAEKHLIALEMRKLTNSQYKGGNTRRSAGNDVINGGSTLIRNSANGHNNNNNNNNNLYLVYELSKYYGRLMAVKEVSFRVKQRECFGLLGVNGAGKSTTFRMLTGEEVPNSGLMYLGKSGITSDRRNYLSEMGYCPQTDAIIGTLNAFDHLRLFARLRGISKENVNSEVDKWIKRLNLNACKSQPSGTYSGGNKRRLNIAMALIGNPRLVLLDEPTTGVDPAARRTLWNVLRDCQATGQAIILTSHSMEECEALCNRLVIMVRGELVCVGPSQELKHRFGAGYDIHIKVNPTRTDDDVTAIKRIMESTLSCEIRDENLGLIAYHVNSTETWQTMYDTMKDLRNRFSCIEDYSVLSATLEQLFMQFARAAEKSTSDNLLPKYSASQAVHV